MKKNIIKNGFFETTFIDLEKKISYIRQYQFLKQTSRNMFFTVIDRRYLIKLEWKNPVQSTEKIHGIYEDVIFRNLDYPFVCLIEKKKNNRAFVSIGVYNRLVYKRPIASVDDLFIERDESIAFLKQFFSNIEFITYTIGCSLNSCEKLPNIKDKLCSYYLFDYDQKYKKISIFFTLLNFFLLIAYGVFYLYGDLEKNIQEKKIDFSYIEDNYQNIPLNIVFKDMKIINYFGVKIDKIFYKNKKLKFYFRGPKDFEKYLFPVLDNIFPYKHTYFKNTYTLFF